MSLQKNCGKRKTQGTKWCRLYASTLNNYKVNALTDSQFRTWVGCLCVATTRKGRLPAPRQLAFELRQPLDQTDRDVAALIAGGLIDETSTGLMLHDWNQLQFESDSSAQRMRKLRSKKTNDVGDVTSHARHGDGESDGICSVSPLCLSEEERSYPSSQGNVVSLGNSYARVTRGGDA